VQNASTQTAHPGPLLRWEGHPDLLAQTLQARQEQGRANALADRQCEQQIDGLAVIELQSAQPDARR
jgi:hypothetical protein